MHRGRIKCALSWKLYLLPSCFGSRFATSEYRVVHAYNRTPHANNTAHNYANAIRHEHQHRTHNTNVRPFIAMHRRRHRHSSPHPPRVAIQPSAALEVRGARSTNQKRKRAAPSGTRRALTRLISGTNPREARFCPNKSNCFGLPRALSFPLSLLHPPFTREQSVSGSECGEKSRDKNARRISGVHVRYFITI